MRTCTVRVVHAKGTTENDGREIKNGTAEALKWKKVKLKQKKSFESPSAFPRHNVDTPTSTDSRNMDWKMRMHTKF
jgi:hypothetical protein